PSAAFGTSSCSPTADVSGASFICHFYGLPPGATPINYTLSIPGQADFTEQIPQAVASDGSYHITTEAFSLGLRTATATAGPVSKSASLTRNSPTPGLQTTQRHKRMLAPT